MFFCTVWPPGPYPTKALRMMKLTTIFLFLACIQVSAAGYSQTVTLNEKNAKLADIFSKIKKQTGYLFWYRNDMLQKAKPVTISVKNMALQEVLPLIFKDQPLDYSIVNNTVVVEPKRETKTIASNASLLPPVDIKGRVLNEKREPIEGVTVSVKGTARTALTNNNGEFSLAAIEQHAVLIFTHVSMESFELNVNGKAELLVRLTTRVSALEDVVVSINTGYQQISKERFVGSVSTLDSAAFHRRAGMAIIDRLEGTVTGILFDKKSGNSLVNLQIRGMSTIPGMGQSASSDPLIIVDNFPYRQSLDLINPNDIESLTVLKDAAAASIWGARAGNGVIVITTKKGKYNQPVKVAVSSNVTIQEKPDLYYYPQMKVSDFVDGEIFLFNKGAYDANLSNTVTWPVISPVMELLAKKKAGKISDAETERQLNAYRAMDIRRDMDEWVYRPSILQQHFVQVSGGSNTLNYSFSGGYNRSLNRIQHSRPDDQFSLNSNASLKLVKNLEISSGINLIRSVQRHSDLSLPNVYPYAQLADAEGRSMAIPHGKRIAYLDTAGAGKLLDWKYYPLEELRLANNQNTTRLIALNIGLSYKFTNWLDGKLSYNYVDESANGRTYNSPETFYTRDLINQFTNLSATNPNLRNPVPVGGVLDQLNFQRVSQNIRGQLNVNKSIAKDHLVTVMIAAERSETQGKSDRSRFYGYHDDIGSYNAAIDYITPFPVYGGRLGTRLVPNGSILNPSTNSRFVSFLGNLSYSYQQLLTIYGSARKDGSNAFGVNTNKKWKPLWSVGASVDISKTSWLGNGTFINLLRLRSSFGYSGNPGNGSGLPTISYGTNPALLTNITNWAFPNDPPNANLGWEKVRTINTGIEFSLFKDRLSGSVDVYQKRTTDIIWYQPVQPSTGVNSIITNSASLKGNGYEIKLHSKNVAGTFTWQTGFTFSHAKTIITQLFRPFKPTAKDFVSYGLHAFEGEMVYGIASYTWAGLDPLTGDPRGYLDGHVSSNYQAIFNDTVRNQSYNGSAIPLYYGNISNSFAWKNFTLSALITYRLGFYFRKPAISYFDLVNGWRGHADYAARWQKPGDENLTTVPSFTYPVNADRDVFYQYSEVNIVRGDNIRLQDIRLDYVWNMRTGKKTPVGVTTFVYANNLNLILWRKNKSDLDPDFTGGPDFMAPTPITWTIGLSLHL
jgi:TonB-dependent starch-binding outer membrane protein SusC